MQDYDTPELTVLERMKRHLKDESDWVDADFDELTFLDIEFEYFAAGGKEFRA
jgi:hypothetical protein